MNMFIIVVVVLVDDGDGDGDGEGPLPKTSLQKIQHNVQNCADGLNLKAPLGMQDRHLPVSLAAYQCQNSVQLYKHIYVPQQCLHRTACSTSSHQLQLLVITKQPNPCNQPTAIPFDKKGEIAGKITEGHFIKLLFYIFSHFMGSILSQYIILFLLLTIQFDL